MATTLQERLQSTNTSDVFFIHLHILIQFIIQDLENPELKKKTDKKKLYFSSFQLA